MKRIKMLAAAAIIGGAMLIGSCKKNDATGTMYKVRMTDGPGPYSQVNVDIRSVQVVRTDGSMVTLSTNAGVYNLLRYSNDIDTLIASGNVSAGTVQSVKLTLGSNNTVVKDGSSYPMAINSGDDAGLTLAIHQNVVANTTTELLVDFDANQSVVTDDNGATYHLRPVLRTIGLDVSATGSIMGHITPANTNVVITVTGNGGTFSTSATDDGHFRIRGLTQGTYTVTITPPSPLTAVTVPNIVVTAGETADIGLVAF